MRHLNSAYAGWFNRRHGRINSLFGDRYHSVLVESEAYMQRLARYVVLNPVRAGMVDRAENYPWSSYRATAGLSAPPAWLDLEPLVQYFGDRHSWRANYVQFVNDSEAAGDDIWRGLRRQIFLVSEEFLRRNLKKILRGKMRSDTHPVLQRFAGSPPVHAIASAVAEVFGAEKRRVLHGRGGVARRLIAWLAWFDGTHRLRKIAALLRVRSTGHVSNLVKRADLELQTDAHLRIRLDAVRLLLG